MSDTDIWGQEGWKQMNQMCAPSPPCAPVYCALDSNCLSPQWLWALKHLHESEQHVTFTRRQCDNQDKELDLSLTLWLTDLLAQSRADKRWLNETLTTACIHCEMSHGLQSHHIRKPGLACFKQMVKMKTAYSIIQGCPILLLDGHCPAGFSSNSN